MGTREIKEEDMKLRQLKKSDAQFMLEWMHDKSVVSDLATDFSKKTICDCENFINNAVGEADKIKQGFGTELHLAIVSDSDEYMGTVSLKHIDLIAGDAEFAITVRKEAMTKGYSWHGMVEMLRIGFEELNLQSIYWCVSERNTRACHFYDKHKFHVVLDIPLKIKLRYANVDDLRWYSVLAGDDYVNESLSRGEVAGCKIININTIPTVNAGELSFFESTHDFDFEIKRIYYISKVPEGVRRGFHAHKELKQILFCPYGKIQLILDNGRIREEITLSDPSIGVVIDYPVWREMLWLQKDSVLCVAASDFYIVEDYIRDYNEFKNTIIKREN